MKIVLATSEAVPFAKTGGLADVCGALPLELARLGHEVTLIMPAYRTVLQGGFDLRTHRHSAFHPDWPEDRRRPSCSRASCPAAESARTAGPKVPVYFVARTTTSTATACIRSTAKTIATTASGSCSSAGRCSKRSACLKLDVDVVHCNDWQTGLIPALLQIEYRAMPAVRKRRLADHRPQPRLPGHILALGHAADRPRLEVFQLAPDGVLRRAQPAEDRPRVCRRDQHRQPALRRRNPKRPARAAGWKACCRAAARDLFGILNGVDYCAVESRSRSIISCSKYGPQRRRGRQSSQQGGAQARAAASRSNRRRR